MKIFTLIVTVALVAFNCNSIISQNTEIEKAISLSQNQNWIEAQIAWKLITERNPYNGKYWIYLGEACFKVKNYKKSTEALIKAVEAGQSYDKYNSASYLMVLIAQNFVLENNKTEAIYWLKKASETKQGILPWVWEEDTIFVKHLSSEKEYQKLAPPKAKLNVSTNEQWLNDLHYLASTVETRHFDLFAKVNKEVWQSEVKKIEKMIPKLSDLEIMGEMTKLVALAKDGHTLFIPFMSPKHLFHKLPVLFYEFKEGIFIKATSKEHKHLAGAKLLAVGKVPIEDVKQRLNKYVSGENKFTSKITIPLYLTLVEYLYLTSCTNTDSTVMLTVETNGIKTDVLVKGTIWTDFSSMQYKEGKNMVHVYDTCKIPKPLYLKNIDKPFWYDYDFDRKLVYFQLNNVIDMPSKSLDNFSDSLFNFIERNPVNTLIIDLRLNNGGNTYKTFGLMKRLITSKVNKKGALFTIIGQNTYSAAVNLTTSIEKYTESIFLGEPVPCSPNFTGENVIFKLPNSECLLSVSNINWIGGVNSNDFRTWIAPDVQIELSINEYNANIDPVMNYVYKLLEKNR